MSEFTFDNPTNTGISISGFGDVRFVHRGRVYEDHNDWYEAIVAERCRPLVECLIRTVENIRYLDQKYGQMDEAYEILDDLRSVLAAYHANSEGT